MSKVTPSDEGSELYDLDDRAFFQKDGSSLRMHVGQGTLDCGIYRITNSELKARIGAVFFYSFNYGR